MPYDGTMDYRGRQRTREEGREGERVSIPPDCLALLNRQIPRDKYTEAKPANTGLRYIMLPAILANSFYSPRIAVHRESDAELNYHGRRPLTTFY